MSTSLATRAALPRFPPDYEPVIQCCCHIDRVSVSGRSGALRCAPECAASTLHRQIVLFGGGEVLDVVQMDECAVGMTFGKVSSDPCLAVLTAHNTAVLLAVKGQGRMHEVGRWAGVEGVCFGIKEGLQSACHIQRKGVPLLITNLKPHTTTDGSDSLSKVAVDTGASLLVGQGAAERCADMALAAQTHRNEQMIERLHTQEAVLAHALALLTDMPLVGYN